MAQAYGNADKLISRITDAAREEAAATLAGAEAECKRIALLHENDLFDVESESANRIKSEREAILERSRTNAALDSRKYALKTRRALVDETFAQAGQELNALGGEKRSALLEKLLLDEAEGGEYLILAEADEKTVRGELMLRVNDALRASGREALVMGGITNTISGGFILKAAGYEKNCSFEALVRDARGACESEVASVLFG